MVVPPLHKAPQIDGPARQALHSQYDGSAAADGSWALALQDQRRKTVHPTVYPNHASIPPLFPSAGIRFAIQCQPSSIGFFSSLLGRLCEELVYNERPNQIGRLTKWEPVQPSCKESKPPC